jgi:hypothetical protein
LNPRPEKKILGYATAVKDVREVAIAILMVTLLVGIMA